MSGNITWGSLNVEGSLEGIRDFRLSMSGSAFMVNIKDHIENGRKGHEGMFNSNIIMTFGITNRIFRLDAIMAGQGNGNKDAEDE